MFGHVLSGMEQNPALWIYRNLLLWLLFYTGGMLLTGRIAAQEIFQKKYYILIRYGNYEKWWQYLFIKIIREMFFYVLAVWIICNLGMLFISEEFTLSNKIKILSFFLLVLSWTMLAVIQMVIMLWMENMKVPFVFMLLCTIAALCGSEQLDRLGKFIPFNWGMILRSNIYQEQGYSIVFVFFSEIVTLVFLYRYFIRFRQRLKGEQL